MEFLDPLPITCENCKHEAEYDVRSLLDYKGRCVECYCSLDAVSDQMNGSIDEENAFVALIMLLIEIEAKLHYEYKDDVLELIITVQDLLTVTENDIGPVDAEGRRTTDELMKFLLETYQLDHIDLDAPVLAALGIEPVKRRRG